MIRRMRPIALLLALAACVSKNDIPSLTTVTGVDLRRYSAKGFYFSDESYAGPHDAVGMITVAQYAAATWVPDSAKWMLTPVRAQDVVDTVYTRAVSLGADAFVRMTFRPVVREPVSPGQPALPGLEISGFAIRRRSQ